MQDNQDRMEIKCFVCISAAPSSATYKGRSGMDSNSKENAIPGGMSRPKTSHVSTSSSTGESPKVSLRFELSNSTLSCGKIGNLSKLRRKNTRCHKILQISSAISPKSAIPKKTTVKNSVVGVTRRNTFGYGDNKVPIERTNKTPTSAAATNNQDLRR